MAGHFGTWRVWEGTLYGTVVATRGDPSRKSEGCMGTWSQACHTRRMGHRLCACRRHCETHAEGACASGGRFAEPWASSVSALFLGRCFLGAVAEDTLY